MIVYLLYHDLDGTGASEEWNVFYTPVEVFLTPELREARKDYIKSINPAYEFHEVDIVVSATANEQVA